MDTAEIVRAVAIRSAAAEIPVVQDQIKALDAQIAKLNKRRDILMQRLGWLSDKAEVA